MEFKSQFSRRFAVVDQDEDDGNSAAGATWVTVTTAIRVSVQVTLPFITHKPKQFVGIRIDIDNFATNTANVNIIATGDVTFDFIGKHYSTSLQADKVANIPPGIEHTMGSITIPASELPKGWIPHGKFGILDSEKMPRISVSGKWFRIPENGDNPQAVNFSNTIPVPVTYNHKF